MKKSIYLSLLFTCSIFINLNATTIVIGGCTHPHAYSIVRVHDDNVECTGVGRLMCPSMSASVESYSHIIYPIEKITDFVLSEISNGERQGEVLFQNDLPVSWKIQTNDELHLIIGDFRNHGLIDTIDK